MMPTIILEIKEDKSMTKTEHINCGGELRLYIPTEAELKSLNRYFKKEHQPPIVYYTTKEKRLVLKEPNVYQCDKCGAIIRVLTMFSYNEMVELGDIKPKIYFFMVNSDKICSKCGTQNNRNNKKCRGCGAKLSVNIPKPRTITGTERFGL